MNPALLPPSHKFIFYVWSFEHNSWWAPFYNGYTKELENAGIYNLGDALSIVENANGNGIINEEIRYTKKSEQGKAEPEKLEGRLLVFLVNNIPEEFWGVLSYIAYKGGHSAGDVEILHILEELCFGLKASFEEFRVNIINAGD